MVASSLWLGGTPVLYLFPEQTPLLSVCHSSGTLSSLGVFLSDREPGSLCLSLVAEQWLRLSVTQSLLGGFLSFYPSPPLPLPLPTSSSLLPSHPPSLAVTTVLGEDGARGDGRRRKKIVFHHSKTLYLQG